jgi:hypothetical protein
MLIERDVSREPSEEESDAMGDEILAHEDEATDDEIDALHLASAKRGLPRRA